MTGHPPAPPIDPARLWSRLQELASIGTTPEGGVTRLAFTPEDRRATDLVAGWMREAGLEVRTDTAGNTFGRRPGRRDGPAVLLGSHLDTVPNGGRFDGAAGVLAALEVLTTFEDTDVRTEWPVELAIFANEEGTRFSGGLHGSLALTGSLDDAALDEQRDGDGVTLRQALEAFGVTQPSLTGAARPRGSYRAYLELHIEQSVALEEAGVPVGIVTGIAGIHHLSVRIGGRAAHAGAMPMGLRRDPLVAAALVVAEVERAALETSPSARATVGRIAAWPGAHNVIPGVVEFTVDVRDVDDAAAREVVERIERFAEATSRDRDLACSFHERHSTDAVPSSPALVALLEASARRRSVRTMRMPSGAAHDAMIMARTCPMGMLFIRSKNGASHSPEEFSSSDDLHAGAILLADAALRLANDRGTEAP